MFSRSFKRVGLHYTAFRDAIREDSRQNTPSRGVTPRKKFAVEANVESRVRVNETLRRKFTCVAAYFFVRQDSRTSVADYASLRLCRPTASIRLCTACPPTRMSISLRFSSFQLIVHAELRLAYLHHWGPFSGQSYKFQLRILDRVYFKAAKTVSRTSPIRRVTSSARNRITR